jgi:hypothetical protein
MNCYPAGPLSAKPGPKILMNVVVKTTCKLATRTIEQLIQKIHFHAAVASEPIASTCVKFDNVNPAMSAACVPKLRRKD